MNSIRKIVIFGATSAIAGQTARQLVQQGASVYCIGRSQEKLDALVKDLKVRAGSDQVIESQSADLTDTQIHEKLIQDAESALSGLDSALIAHGSLPDQKACESSFAVAEREIHLNAISVISLLTLLGNAFEDKATPQQPKVIAVISSVAGDRGRQSNYVYGAAKGMVSTFAQGLRNRLAKSHVAVVDIKPGFVDTPMTASFDKGGPLWATPDVIASGIIKAMTKGKDIVYLPWFWQGIMLIIKHIPEFIFKRLSL